MKKDIHPEYEDVEVHCRCGARFVIRSVYITKKKILDIDVCSSCHQFYTGKQKIVDAAGRVEKFNRRYAGFRPTEKT